MNWQCTTIRYLLKSLQTWRNDQDQNPLHSETPYLYGYRSTCNIRRTLVGNKFVDYSYIVGASLSALLQLHLHSQLNTRLEWLGQDETRNISILGSGATYIRCLTVLYGMYCGEYWTCYTGMDSTASPRYHSAKFCDQGPLLLTWFNWDKYVDK